MCGLPPLLWTVQTCALLEAWLSVKCVTKVKVRTRHNIEESGFVIDETLIYLSFDTPRRVHRARWSPRGPPGPNEPMKTDCGRVGSRLWDARQRPTLDRAPTSICQSAARLSADGPWKSHLAFGNRIKSKMPTFSAATCAENWIGSIWSKPVWYDRESCGDVVSGLAFSATTIDQRKTSHTTSLHSHWLAENDTVSNTRRHTKLAFAKANYKVAQNVKPLFHWSRRLWNTQTNLRPVASLLITGEGRFPKILDYFQGLKVSK